MTTVDSDSLDAALLLVDVQQGIDNPLLGPRSTPDAESNIARLLDRWRAQGLPVIHVRHCSREPDSQLRPELPGNAFKPADQPISGEPQFAKSSNSAFIGTGLEHHLRAQGIKQLVIVGLTTDHCVSATVRNAADLGFDVKVVADATAAFGKDGFDGVFYSADAVHRINLVSLDNEFCTICLTAELL